MVHRLDRVIHLGNPRYRPADDVSQHTIRADLGERAAIESHLLADSAEAVPYRVIDVIGGKIDDLRGQLGDEPFEREQLFERGPVRTVLPAPFADVHDGRQDEEAIRRRHSSQADFNGELRTVLAPADELTTGAQGPWIGSLDERLAYLAKRLRHQQIDDLPDELVSRVPELTFQLAIEEHDLPLGIHDQDATRQRLDGELERCRVEAGLRHRAASHVYFAFARLTPVSLTSSDA